MSQKFSNVRGARKKRGSELACSEAQLSAEHADHGATPSLADDASATPVSDLLLAGEQCLKLFRTSTFRGESRPRDFTPVKTNNIVEERKHDRPTRVK